MNVQYYDGNAYTINEIRLKSGEHDVNSLIPYRYQYHSKYEIFAEQGHNQTVKEMRKQRG